jgi:ubiquinone/menaquinone biosynthesis C-methylase UbiE
MVPILWADGSRTSKLEQMDYAALQPVNERTVRQIGSLWSRVFETISRDSLDTLEIGAGTGILTSALLENEKIQSLVASDVSCKFMFAAAHQYALHPRFRGAVVNDANEAVFADNSFDLVLGRSILHHLIDYPTVLRRVHSHLRLNGAAVFFEPVLEGKSIVSLAAALILHSNEVAGCNALSRTDVTILKKTLRHQTKSEWYPQTREDLAKLEDKYIFRIEDLKKTARACGFSSAEFLDYQTTDDSYWLYIQNTLRAAGIAIETLKRFRWIAEAIRESYLCSTFHIPSPMGFFVFRK